MEAETLSKNGVNFHYVCHWRHSLRIDLSDHFFWSEYRVNRARFHSLSNDFSLSLYLKKKKKKIIGGISPLPPPPPPPPWRRPWMEWIIHSIYIDTSM